MSSEWHESETCKERAFGIGDCEFGGGGWV